MGINNTVQINVIANREIRVVPLGWEHPQDGDGRPTLLFAEEMPDVSDLADSQVGLAVYETTTEGRTALLDYCVMNVPLFAAAMGTREQWERLLAERDLVAVPLDGLVGKGGDD